MIYNVIKDNITFEIDDEVFFNNQPKEFRVLYDELKKGNTVEFDNCTVTVFDTGRVIITEREVQDGE